MDNPATTPENSVSLEVRVWGRVQGVGFRYFAHDVARRLKLGGYVTNLPDGSVRAYAEGPRSALAEFLRHVEKGAERFSRARGEEPLGPGNRSVHVLRHRTRRLVGGDGAPLWSSMN